MASHPPTQSILALRAITYRISSTPTKQLPHNVQQIAASLWNCKDLISAPQQAPKSNNENTTHVHRFRTSVSSLLQDRTVEGRWAGVVLAKATLEAGGLEILSKCGAWVKSLLTILKRPDPPTTRVLAVLTLTRIFTLTWDHANLVREITTPNLPAFVSTCLSNAENPRCSASEFQTILEAFAILLPRHPTIFRSQEGLIRDLSLRPISSKTLDGAVTLPYAEEHKSIAGRLLALLPHCAPKQGAAEKWREALQNDLATIHSTCDILFRSIMESSDSDHATRKRSDANAPHAESTTNGKQEYLGAYPPERVFAHAQRLIALLGVLQQHIETTTANTVAVPIGQFIDLITRLFNIVTPMTGDAASVKTNPQIAKDERDLMFALLPEIHVAALKLLVSVIDRFGASVVSIVQSLLERALDVFMGEKGDANIKTATYDMLRSVLELSGPSMSKEEVAELTPIMRSCCSDLMPHETNVAPTPSTNGNAVTAKQQLHASEANITGRHLPTQTRNVHVAARALLVTLINKVDSASIPRKLRVQIERIAILSQDHDALVACVLNPAKNASGTAAQTSLLPLLAKLFPESSEVEALLRPRMPVVSLREQTGRKSGEVFDGDKESVASGASEAGKEDLLEEVDAFDQSTDVSNPLQQNTILDNQANEDDLYTASPRLLSQGDTLLEHPQLEQNGLTNLDSAIKRPAVEPLDDRLSTKRLRADPVVDSAVPESATAAPPEISVRSAENLPVEVPDAQADLYRQTGLDTKLSSDEINDARAVSYCAASNLLDNAMDSESGSDVEVPPLTMESDSEPAEDDED